MTDSLGMLNAGFCESGGVDERLPSCALTGKGCLQRSVGSWSYEMHGFLSWVVPGSRTVYYRYFRSERERSMSSAL